MKCSNCGKELENDSTLCPNCSTKSETVNGIDMSKVSMDEPKDTLEKQVNNNFASFGKRIGSFLIDGFIMFIICMFISFLLMRLVDLDFYNNTIPSILVMTFFYFSIASLWFGQALASIFKRKTIGMMIFKFEIKNVDGSKLSIGKCFLRFLIYIGLIFIGIGIIGNIVVLYMSKQKQSLVDVLTNTVGIMDN